VSKSLTNKESILDLMYYTIDLVTNLFGMTSRLYSQLNFKSLNQDYTINDATKVVLIYQDKINTTLMMSKIYMKKTERVRIFGDKGYVTLDDRTVNLLNTMGDILESHSFNTKESKVDAQLDYFITNLYNKKLNEISNNKNLADQFINIKVIDAIYHSNEAQEVVKFN